MGRRLSHVRGYGWENLFFWLFYLRFFFFYLREILRELSGRFRRVFIAADSLDDVPVMSRAQIDRQRWGVAASRLANEKGQWQCLVCWSH